MTMPAPFAPGDDRRVQRYARRTVYPHSAYYQQVLGAGAVDVARIPPTDLADVRDPGALVLRPNLQSILRAGPGPLAARAVIAKIGGGMHRFNHRVVEDRFKPIHWVVGGGVPIGYSATDLQRLAARGEAWLGRAGVGRRDVVLSVLDPGPSVAHWQLVLGCRRARISAMHLDPSTDPEWAERLAPSVLAGEPRDLVALLARAREAGHTLANLRTVLAVGDPLDLEARASLRALAPGAAVVGAWAPPGVRALWTECRTATDGAAVIGYHAWDDDVLEVGPGRELLWTGVGWRGSALLRLRTHVAVTVDRGPCPACGRRPARIIPHIAVAADSGAPDHTGVAEMSVAAAPETWSPAQVLDGEAEVAAWQVELRSVDGRPEMIVLVAPAPGAAVVPLVRRLDRHLHATQFVVLAPEEVSARIGAAGGQVIDGAADLSPQVGAAGPPPRAGLPADVIR
ncbi:MAG: phenylacetate--CoA ligase family protein [Acidimicrobiales bacterium]